jgi:hypothetical protein
MDRRNYAAAKALYEKQTGASPAQSEWLARCHEHMRLSAVEGRAQSLQHFVERSRASMEQALGGHFSSAVVLFKMSFLRLGSA